MEKYDLVVIGGGPAGEKAAAKASYFGKKVALVERNASPGGAGVHTGTLPSKTLKETALFLSGKNDKGIFGVDKDLRRHASIEDFYFRKNYVTESEVKAINTNIHKHKISLYSGVAEFQTQHSILVRNEKTGNLSLESSHFLIATGSYPFRPSHFPFDGERVHDSDTILSLKRFPKSICVLGGGVIGCEYTTIFATLGIPVYLVDTKDEILPFLDQEITTELVKEMRREGIEVIFQAGVDSIEKSENPEEPLTLHLSNGSKLFVDMFLFAAGRSGNSSHLGLEKIGVKVGKRELIEVNETYQTSLPNIYAVGDVIGFPALASTSMDQGRVAVTHMFSTAGFGKIAGLFPYGIYTVPEVSMVGITEREAIQTGKKVVTGIAKYENMARGKILGSESGFLKLVADRETQVILGVHIIGVQATEIIHYGLALVESQKTLSDVISVAFNFPTLHDLYKYAAYDGLGNLSGHKLK